MRVYQENINRFNEFHESDYYRNLELQNSTVIADIFSILSRDPDARDWELYHELAKRYDFSGPVKAKPSFLEIMVENQNIRLSADIICGRRQLVALHDGNFEGWIEDYQKVRSSLNLHFLWPKHKLPTINTLRYSAYLDRIDCLLFDLKEYFNQKETPMCLAYRQDYTALWLQQFSGFKDFIDKMKLTEFVNENYDVYDIAKDGEAIIDKIITREEIKLSLNMYLRNMIDRHTKEIGE